MVLVSDSENVEAAGRDSGALETPSCDRFQYLHYALAAISFSVFTLIHWPQSVYSVLTLDTSRSQFLQL